jgi:OmpA-OmpF porin, OOP family
MKLSQPLFWLLTLFWFVAGSWWYSCNYCKECVSTDSAQVPPFKVSDGSWSHTSKYNLRFGRSSSIPFLGGDIVHVMDSLTRYSQSHSNKLITVTGYYKGDEKNNTAFENLGLARAAEMKKYLVGKGVMESNILLQSKMESNLFFLPSDTLVGGIAMNISSKPLEVAAAEADLFEPRTVYFNTGKNVLNVDEGLKKYLENARAYLEKNPTKKLTVTGHTDNVGNPEKNIQLSAQRAEFVKGELHQYGIGVDRIESSGKGMAEPIEDNSTAEGRTKNRRVTIQLKQ